MKKILLLLSILLLTGCTNTYEIFMDSMTNEYAYSYKPSTRLVKRVLYYNNPEEIINQFGGNFNELHYIGRILTHVSSDHYIMLGCIKQDSVRSVTMEYRNSIIYIDGNQSINDKHLFVYHTDHFEHYLILRKRWKPELDWIYWEIDKLEKGY